MANVNNSVLKERLKSNKFFIYATVIAILAVDVVLTALLMAGGLAFTAGLAVFLITVFDLGLFVGVIASNFRFKYSRILPFVYVGVSVLVCGVLTLVLNLELFYLLAMIIFAVFRIVSGISLLVCVSNGAKKGGALKITAFLFTALLVFISCFYFGYAIKNGVFGQGEVGFRTVRYVYSELDKGYVAQPIAEAKGDKVTIAKEFNGQKVTGVYGDFFEDKSIKEIYLDCGTQFKILNSTYLNNINDNLKVFVDKSEIDAVKERVIGFAKEIKNDYKDNYMSLYNMIVPDGLADNEVYITFDYTYQDIEYSNFEPIKTWIGKKGDTFNLTQHAIGVSYVEGFNDSDAQAYEDFLINNLSRGKVLCPLKDGEESILGQSVNGNLSNVKVHFETIYKVTIDSVCNDTLYDIATADAEFFKTDGVRYVVGSDPFDLLSEVALRDGFTLDGWEYKTTGTEKTEFTKLTNILNQDVTVSPVWKLNAPVITDLRLDKNSYIYGDTAKFTVDATAPTQGIELSYVWKHFGNAVADQPNSNEYTKTNISPALENGDAGNYEVRVTASSSTLTSLTSESYKDITLNIGKKPLNFNEWILPGEVYGNGKEKNFVYNGEEQTVKASYVESDVINNDNITVEMQMNDGQKVASFERTIKNAGNYKFRLELTGLCSELYEIASNQTASVNIAKKVIQLEWSGYENLVYDGTEKNVTATPTGVVGGDYFELTITGGNGKDATEKNNGTAYQATATIDPEQWLLLSMNYALENPTCSYTISQREITVEWYDETEFTYNGQKQGPQVERVYGKVDTDGSIIQQGVGWEIGANNAGNPTHTATAVIKDKNYKFADGAETTRPFVIKPKPVDIVWDNTEFTYNGSERLPTASIADGGLVGTDRCSIYVYGKQTDVGTYTATTQSPGAGLPGGLSNGNYEIRGVYATCEFTINKKPITPVITNNNLTYNGLTQDIAVKLNGVISGDDCSPILSTSQVCEAGNYEVIVTSIYGLKANNYQLPENYKMQFTVKKAPLTLYAQDKTITYGDQVPELTIEYVGFVQAEDESLFGTKPTLICNYIQGGNVGKYDIVFTQQGSYTLANYEIQTIKGTLTVEKRNITVTVDNLSSVYGEPIKELTAKITSGELYGTDIPYNLRLMNKGNTSVGTYDITCTPANSGNYNVTSINGTYTIEQRVVTLDWGTKTTFTKEEFKSYLLPEIVSGTVNGDDVRINCQFSKDVNSLTAGEHIVTITAILSNGNYKADVETFQVTIIVPQVPEVIE